MQDTRTPLRVNLVVVALDVVVSALLFLTLPTAGGKVAGLAVANTVAYAVGTALLQVGLRRRLGGVEGPRIARTLARALAASLALGGAAWAATAAVRVALGTGLPGDLAAVGGGVAASAGVYLLVARLLGVEELTILLPAARRRRPAPGRDRR